MTDQKLPFQTTVIVRKVFDHQPTNRSFDAVDPSDPEITYKVWKVEKGDDTHQQLIQIDDKITLEVTGAAQRSTYQGKLLPRDKQPVASQREWRRRARGQFGAVTRVEGALLEADHQILRWAHKMHQRLDPSLTQEEFVTAILKRTLDDLSVSYLMQETVKQKDDR